MAFDKTRYDCNSCTLDDAARPVLNTGRDAGNTRASESRWRGKTSREEEAALISQIHAGDQDACTLLVTLHRPQMMAIARRFMRCEEDCNDAVQDALISAFRALRGFEAGSRLATWLCRITVNACRMKLRRGRSRRETSIEEFPPGVEVSPRQPRGRCAKEPVSELEFEETRVQVRLAIDRIPDAYRTVLLMRDIEEMDTIRTARLLEISENNVKSRLNRARRALRGILKPIMTG